MKDDSAVVLHAASLDVEGLPPTVHPPRWTVGTTIGGRDYVVRPRCGTGHPVPLPRHDRDTLGPETTSLTADSVESPLRGDTHGGFGERPGETGREQPRHRAPGRLIAKSRVEAPGGRTFPMSRQVPQLSRPRRPCLAGSVVARFRMSGVSLVSSWRFCGANTLLSRLFGSP